MPKDSRDTLVRLMATLVGVGLVGIDGFMSVASGVEEMEVSEHTVTPEFVRLLADYYRLR